MIELDQKIKSVVSAWREQDYKGASAVTQRLLEWWFVEDHFLKSGENFEFWRAQRQAIEALIYVYEVCGYHNTYSLGKNFGVNLNFDLTTDNWPKYCFKMATGSGKTLVMALAIVWQYYNRFLGTANGRRYATKFLVIAPNLIVLDRLDEAFADNAIFREFPMLPPEWEADWDLQRIKQSEVKPATSRGLLYLTNVQQLYATEPEKELNALAEALGPPVSKNASLNRADLQEELAHWDELCVLNDEAHHVHSDDLEWNQAIDRLHQGCLDRKGRGLTMQMDFSATPYTGAGGSKQFFPHIIYNYPLAAAIRDQVVKRPKIGEIEHAPESKAKDFVKRNRLQIDTGVEVFQRFQKDLKKSEKKPVLFLMTDVTKNADKVGEYLEDTHRLKTLVIHTDAKGVITKKGLEEAREAARSIDTNEYQAIVSVMMLKEGWDVKNVCVIVPLRSYASSILAEQTLGRGLRRMSRPNAAWEEKLIVIDHPRFRDLWEAEIRDEDLDIEITDARQAYEPINVVKVDPSKMQFDLAIPILVGGITRDVRKISELNVSALPGKLFKLDEIELPKIMYREKDLLTQKVELERELAFDYTDRRDIFLSAMTKAILSKCAASGQFAEVLPKVEQFVQERLFERRVNLEDAEVVRKLNYLPVREKIREVLTDAILRLQVKEEPYQLSAEFRMSELQPFHTSEPTYPAKKTVFEALPYSRRSEYEKKFMRWLDEQKEVLAYTKILPLMPLRIPYHDANGYLRHYLPDFVVKTKERYYLIETKGEGWDDQQAVRAKDAAAAKWCLNVSELARQTWSFFKLLETDFQRYQGLGFSQLVKAAKGE